MVERRPIVLNGGEFEELPTTDTLPGAGGEGTLAVQRRQKFSATPGQTLFTTEEYTPQFLDVFLNGVHLIDVDDYTATSGTTVILLVEANEFDIVEVISFETYLTANLTHNNLTGYVADEHIDWRTDQGAKNISPENIPKLKLSAADTISLLSAENPAQVGDVALENLIFDEKGIQARNNGVAAPLYLNPLGGNVIAPAFVGDGSGLTGLNTAMNILLYKDPAIRTFSTSWGIGMTTTNFIKSAGSLVLFSCSMPMRNDSGSWGGSFNRLEYSLDDGATWISLGDTGYDGPMVNGGDIIGIWGYTQIIDLAAIVDSTQVRFRFQHKSYDSTLSVGLMSNVTDGPAYSMGSPQMSILEIKV